MQIFFNEVNTLSYNTTNVSIKVCYSCKRQVSYASELIVLQIYFHFNANIHLLQYKCTSTAIIEKLYKQK